MRVHEFLQESGYWEAAHAHNTRSTLAQHTRAAHSHSTLARTHLHTPHNTRMHTQARMQPMACNAHARGTTTTMTTTFYCDCASTHPSWTCRLPTRKPQSPSRVSGWRVPALVRGGDPDGRLPCARDGGWDSEGPARARRYPRAYRSDALHRQRAAIERLRQAVLPRRHGGPNHPHKPLHRYQGTNQENQRDDYSIDHTVINEH